MLTLVLLAGATIFVFYRQHMLGKSENFFDEIGTFNSEIRRVNTLVTVAETFDNKVCGLGTILDARFLDFFH